MKKQVSIILLMAFILPMVLNTAAKVNADDKVMFFLLTDQQKEVRDKARAMRLKDYQPQVDADKVYEEVDQMPEFPGGQSALKKYLSDNIKYPALAAEYGKQGTAIIQFVVNADGSISDVEVARSAGDSSLDKEAIRVVKSMPKWNPGTQNGVPTKVRYTLPVTFKLQ